MKKLFIYYSYSGSGDIVSKKFEEYGYSIRKVVSKRNLPCSFFWSMMIGGMLGGLKHKSKLVNFDNDISEYSEIVIGSPVWNGNFACPTNTILSKLNLENKKVSFVLYSGSGESLKLREEIKTKYHANVIELKEPKKYLNSLNALDIFKENK